MPATSNDINQLTDHLFRRESGKMVSVLTKIFGIENLELSEDVIQETFITAVQTWALKGLPDNPSGWLMQVAKNKAIDVLRKNKFSVAFDFNDPDRILLQSEYTLSTQMEKLWQQNEIKDDLMRMMFACCHPGIYPENQITLILKTLCGFSTAEIAAAFLTSAETVSKRIYRTKEFFRERKIKPEFPNLQQIPERIPSVLNAIYLIFNEGYNSSHADELIRKDLLDQALYLCKLLCDNPHTQNPGAFALMALMCFHSSRNNGRLTSTGEIILLPNQDRSKWNQELIVEGNYYMNKAAFGNLISSYHLEAAIAFEHCTAETFAKTNWPRILELYEWLCKITNSPITELNKAVAEMQVYGPERALQSLQNIKETKKLESYYLYHSFLGELNTRMHKAIEARKNFGKAIQLTESPTEKKMLKEKIAMLEN